MKKFNLIYIASVIILFMGLFISCSENISYNEDAKLVTLSQILQDPSLYSFKAEYDYYKVDTALVNQIKNTFDINKHKIYLFANLSCGCTSQQTDIADLSKIIEAASIPVSNYEIYNIRSSSSNHPYKTLFNLNEIPECVIMKDTVAIYFVIDTFTINKLSGKTIPYEQLILDGLKK